MKRSCWVEQEWVPEIIEVDAALHFITVLRLHIQTAEEKKGRNFLSKGLCFV